MDLRNSYPVNPEKGEFGNGALVNWIRRRQDFGENVGVLHPQATSYGGVEHGTAWLHRNFMDFETGQMHSFYQVACDCMAEHAQPTDSQMDFTYCEDLAQALVLRAHTVSGHIPLQQGETIVEDPVAQAILDVLSYERNRPHTWVANMFSGEHEATLLSLILNRDVAEVVERAHELAEYGLVDLDGDAVRLAA